MGKRIDPVLVSIMDNLFNSIAEEMGQTMLRTSRSPIFSEAGDFATAIVDHKLRLVSQKPYIAVLMGTIPFAVRAINKSFEGNINEGDVYLVNDPYRGGNSHLPDCTVAKPVFENGKLVFWSVAKGHLADIGGKGAAGYNPLATNIVEEGIRIPPVKLYERGDYQQNAWDLIITNVRHSELVEGDIHCLVGTVILGERRVLGLIKKYGINTLNQAVDNLLNASERHVRQEIKNIPNGVYYAERFMDNDGFDRGKMVKVGLQLIVDDDSITFDYSNSDRQVKGYINSTLANTYSSSYLALFTTIDSNIRHNEGAFRPITIIAPEGSIVNCSEPAPCSVCTTCAASTIIEAAWLALSQAVPKLTQAAWARGSIPVTMGFNPRTGKHYSNAHLLSKGGAGATFGFDGWDHMGVVICTGRLRAPDPEMHELAAPFSTLCYEFLQDSPGAGKWRGGMGTRYIFRVEADEIISNNFGDGLLPETAPYGLAGGKGAASSKLRIIKANGEVVDPEVHKFVTLNKGDIYEVLETGGGGYGDPLERPIGKVWADVRNELISVECARNDYGVIIDPGTLKIDYAKTDEIRGKTK